MAKGDMPFDEETMTLIMGLGGPEEPGQHGPTATKGMPFGGAFELITEIRDMCDEFLKTADKEKPEPEMEEDFEEEEE